jgi:hypothetical protein
MKKTKRRLLDCRKDIKDQASKTVGPQVGLDKGYQPNTQVSSMQPPPVGTTTVVPVKNSTTDSTQSGTESKK